MAPVPKKRLAEPWCQCSVGHSPVRIRRIESVAIHGYLKTMLDLHEANDRKAHRLINEQPMKVVSPTVRSISNCGSLPIRLIQSLNPRQKLALGLSTGGAIVHKPASINPSERCETLGHHPVKRSEQGKADPSLCSIGDNFADHSCARTSRYVDQTSIEGASSESNGGSIRTDTTPLNKQNNMARHDSALGELDDKSEESTE